MSAWEVVGGGDKGGILVRKGQELKSDAEADRLSTGAIVEELELIGERLHYKLLSGTGPAEGWVSTKLKDKDLLVPKEEEEGDAGGPAEEGGSVEVDEELKKKIEEMAEKKKPDFPLYAFKYKVMGFPLEKPKARVICFHNAGSTESVFTGAGTPFFVWIKEKKEVELIALDYPGRDKMLKWDKISKIGLLAEDMLAVIYPFITDGTPYIIWGHSVGTWVSFETLQLARKCGCPMPIAAFWMTFPAPHMPVSMRAWHKNKKLNKEQFKEELLKWDTVHFGGAGKVVFDEPEFSKTWEPLMRNDFCLFDEYKFKHNGSPKFDFPIHAWFMEDEHYNKKEMIEMWGAWTTKDFDHQTMKAGHLAAFYKPDQKKQYFTKIVECMSKYTDAL